MLLLSMLACAPAGLERHQLCFYGATEPGDGANPEIDALCESLPSLLRNDDSGLAGFRLYEGDLAEAAMLAALDTDGDGRITDDDTAIVDVLGYSWGGVITTQLDLHALEQVVSSGPVIGRVVTIDPFVPPHDVPLPIVGQVEEIWSYGHSIAPPWDCSTGAPLSPYRSRPIDCSTTTAPCTEYDLSLDRLVGHCSIVDEVGAWALANLVDGRRPAPESLVR